MRAGETLSLARESLYLIGLLEDAVQQKAQKLSMAFTSRKTPLLASGEDTKHVRHSTSILDRQHQRQEKLLHDETEPHVRRTY